MGWAPSYATTEELAAYRRIGDTADDAQLALALATASRAIDQATGRQFGQVAGVAARYYAPRWDPRRCQWYAVIDDLMTATGLVVAYDSARDQTYASAITDYQLRPLNAAGDGRPWTTLYIRPTSAVQPTMVGNLGYAGLSTYGMSPQYVIPEDGLRVTAQWGWPGIPDAIRQACLLQASRLVSRQDAPFGISGSPEMGGELRLLARLDPDVAVAVRPYRRVWGAM